MPKVALHDHLDGGVRPETLLELSMARRLALPANTADLLALEVAKRANSGSLVQYLEAFGWTLPVMQTREALKRIAFEAVEDLAADGVVLGELRFGPMLHTQDGLTPQQAIDAVCDGLAAGTAKTGVPVGLILCGLRHNDEFDTIARLFRDNYGDGSLVVGVDLAGPEFGFPVTNHPAIAQLAKEMPGAPITLHAGEADGVDSIWQAVRAGARRIGHGTRLIDDISADRALLRALVDEGIMLEVCLSSNAQTGSIAKLAQHPLNRFRAEGVLLTLNTDNRLVSATTLSQEYALAHSVFGVPEKELAQMADTGLDVSFMPYEVTRDVRRLHLG